MRTAATVAAVAAAVWGATLAADPAHHPLVAGALLVLAGSVLGGIVSALVLLVSSLGSRLVWNTGLTGHLRTLARQLCLTSCLWLAVALLALLALLAPLPLVAQGCFGVGAWALLETATVAVRLARLLIYWQPEPFQDH